MSATLVSLVVADTRRHGQRELRDMGAETVGVEAVQVAARAAAADQHDGVEFLLPCGDGAEGLHDRLLGGRTLHEGVEERQSEPVGAFVQLLAEVLVACGVGARHHGHALHDGRKRCLAVHVPDPVALQLRDGPRRCRSMSPSV